jgi:hypothetical protein
MISYTKKQKKISKNKTRKNNGNIRDETIIVFHPNKKAIEIPSWRVHDIDNLSDWKRAQMLFKYEILKKNHYIYI